MNAANIKKRAIFKMLTNIMKYVALMISYSYSNESKSFDILIGRYRCHLTVNFITL